MDKLTCGLIICPVLSNIRNARIVLDLQVLFHFSFFLYTDPQTADANVQTDVERFIWSFLAGATAQNYTDPITPLPRCLPSNATSCPAGTVCIGYHDTKGYAGTGACINSTTRYVPAYSTSLECVGCNGTDTYYDFKWQGSDAALNW